MARRISGAVLLGLILVGCGSDMLDPNGNSDGRHRGTLKVHLTDAPIQAQNVFVTLTEIDAHPTGSGWVAFAQTPADFDLLTLSGGKTALLAQAPLAAGSYTGLRLRVSGGYVIDLSGARCELKVPSDKVQINVHFAVAEGSTTGILLDFKADKSLQITQKGNGKECILRPVIQAVNITGGT